MRSGLFLLTFALLITHEMDASFRLEWRVLPGLSSLPENIGQVAFILLHVPLVIALIWLCWEARPVVRGIARVSVASFCIIHAGLHWFFSDHPEYRFFEWDSELLILGAAVTGLVYIALCVAAKAQMRTQTPAP